MVTVFHKFGKSTFRAGRELTPRTGTMLLRFPGMSGGFVWNRPAGIVVDENGERVVVRSRGLTRQFLWALIGLGAAAAVTAGVSQWRLQRRRSRGFGAAMRRIRGAIRRLPAALGG
ncbi:MAG TPA: hypothetical protein VH854_04290 [Thermoanaerobaculia bacterium]|nr:hypothetical protein [Thermoanaerobaculia bacterium]